MNLPAYTVTPCANQGVTLTMNSRTAELVEQAIVCATDELDVWPSDTEQLRNIAVDLTRMRILNAAVSPKSV